MCSIDLDLRRPVTALFMFYDIRGNPNNALEEAYPDVCVYIRLTSQIVCAHLRYLHVPRSRPVQLNRSLIPVCKELDFWMSLLCW